MPLPLRYTRGRKRGLLPLKVRPRSVPCWWRMVDDGAPPRTWGQQCQWPMVLAARHIPFMQANRGQRALFYVPPLLEGIARSELCDYSGEGRNVVAPPPAEVSSVGHWAVLLPLFLLLWHGLRMDWWNLARHMTPPPQLWSTLGALDTLHVRVYHSWYRCVTALTLHADSAHLLGNMAFSALFLILLCRAQGLGLGLFLAVLGGALGNALNVLLRPEPLVSLGFSTALFAAVGALSGTRMLGGGRGKALVPLAAAAAVLAMLGTEGERTDYVAHVAGLVAGVGLGLGAQWVRLCFGIPPGVQWLAGLVVPLLIAGCWFLAGLRV